MSNRCLEPRDRGLPHGPRRRADAVERPVRGDRGWERSAAAAVVSLTAGFPALHARRKDRR